MYKARFVLFVPSKCRLLQCFKWLYSIQIQRSSQITFRKFKSTSPIAFDLIPSAGQRHTHRDKKKLITKRLATVSSIKHTNKWQELFARLPIVPTYILPTKYLFLIARPSHQRPAMLPLTIWRTQRCQSIRARGDAVHGRLRLWISIPTYIYTHIHPFTFHPGSLQPPPQNQAKST